jgi:ATP-dependent Clp protease ATP-binding subunit ClpX
MTKPKNALMKQYKCLIAMDDVDFHITEGALQAIATQAIEKGTGARGLKVTVKTVTLTQN